MSPLAELSSVATVLDDLTKRIATITDDLTVAEREALGSDLLEVERALGTASRRLSRLLANNRPRR